MLQGKTDEMLMAEYRLGNDDAFAILYERHSAKVFGYLRKKTGSEPMARDIFQASFMKLHLTRERYRTDLPFLPWLFTLVRHELIDTLRKHSRNLEDPTASISEIPQPVPVERPEVNLAVLPQAQRMAVQLRYEEDLPFEKIAAQLDTTAANARQLVSRGVKALRRFYGK